MQKFLRTFQLITISLLLAFFGYTFAQDQSPVPDTVTKIIQEVKEKYQPDRRISRFEVTAKLTRDKIILTGETLSPEGKSELISRLKSETDYQIEDSLSVLPDSALGDNIYGIVRVSVAQLRRQPDVYYEIVSQAIMGTEVKILKIQNNYWAFCQLDDDYLGWMTVSSLKIVDEAFINNWRKQEKLIITSNFGQIWERPMKKGTFPVSDVVRGIILINQGRDGDWYQVELPDGRIGYIESKIVAKKSEYFKQVKPARVERIIDLAYEFLGLPYFWGGRSTKGFDCSGFTQILYKLNGILLSRDANMQIKEGIEVPINDSLKNLQPGDLVFFGANLDRITHVGLYIGNGKFIHSDGLVRINSFNPGDENYSEFRRKGLQAVRRIMD